VGKEPFFTQDAYLKPVLENDPLLGDRRDRCLHNVVLTRNPTEYDVGGWSDDEPVAPGSSKDPKAHIALLEKSLSLANQKLEDYRSILMRRIGLDDVPDDVPSKPLGRDDDTHYFRSYADNGET
jgi:type I protein arginine methyltransferase